MHKLPNKKQNLRFKRKMRVRKKLRGTEQKPRMCAVKTNRHIHVQLIDDEKGITLASITTLSKEIYEKDKNMKNKEVAKKLGFEIAQLAKKKEIKEVIFDRGFSKYHGVLAELANAARAEGLKI